MSATTVPSSSYEFTWWNPNQGAVSNGPVVAPVARSMSVKRVPSSPFHS